MSLFLAQASYTSASWKTQVQTQANAQSRVQPLVEGLGGRLVGLYYAFGDYDIVVLMDMPSPEAAAAFALAVSAGGSISSVKTTPLLSIEQGMDAMKKASDAASTYTPAVPGASG